MKDGEEDFMAKQKFTASDWWNASSPVAVSQNHPQITKLIQGSATVKTLWTGNSRKNLNTPALN
jgi:hypothetical protein